MGMSNEKSEYLEGGEGRGSPSQVAPFLLSQVGCIDVACIADRPSKFLLARLITVTACSSIEFCKVSSMFNLGVGVVRSC